MNFIDLITGLDSALANNGPFGVSKLARGVGIWILILIGVAALLMDKSPTEIAVNVGKAAGKTAKTVGEAAAVVA